MSRTTRIIVVMLLLLISITFSPGPADATTRCGMQIGQTYTGAALMQLTGCFTWTTTSNLDAFDLYCRGLAIGVSISNVHATESKFWSGGRRYVRTGCTWTKTLGVLGIGFTTSCYLYADNWVDRYGLHIGPTRSNWC